MDVTTFCAESRVLIVAGKGGVGKTTCVGALALVAARAGQSVLIIELEGKSGLAQAFGRDGAFDYSEVELASPDSTRGAIRARRITPDDALLEYLGDHGLEKVSRRLVGSGVIDVLSTAVPGIRDVLVLGRVKQLERDAVADLILVDAPATGHAITFLTSAGGLLDAARGGPLRTQAADVVELLTDASRCRVLLVTLPEEMPVSETVEAAYQLEDKVGVRLGPVIVNAVDEAGRHLERPAAEVAKGSALTQPQIEALESARRLRRVRFELQSAQRERLRHELPLPQLPTPLLSSDFIGPAELETLADALAGGIAALDQNEAAR